MKKKFLIYILALSLLCSNMGVSVLALESEDFSQEEIVVSSDNEKIKEEEKHITGKEENILKKGGDDIGEGFGKESLEENPENSQSFLERSLEETEEVLENDLQEENCSELQPSQEDAPNPSEDFTAEAEGDLENSPEEDNGEVSEEQEKREEETEREGQEDEENSKETDSAQEELLEEEQKDETTEEILGLDLSNRMETSASKELELQLPCKTTYLIGEKIDLTGAVVTHVESGQWAELTASMVEGFSTEEAGVYTLEVSYNDGKTNFEILVLDPLEEQRGTKGNVLREVKLAENEYGSFQWMEEETILTQIGQNTYMASFQPGEEYQDVFSQREQIPVSVGVYAKLSEETYEIRIKKAEFLYNGYEHRPQVEVVTKDGEEKLQEQYYTLTYENNIDASDEALITVTGKAFYEGSFETTFSIGKRSLKIVAKDVTVVKGEDWNSALSYEVVGLINGDSLEAEPVLEVMAKNSETLGSYDIVIKDAKAGNNYQEEITYVSGKLRIAEEKVGYQVVFYLNSESEALEEYVTYYGIRSGDGIIMPEDPQKEGYVFKGWYQEKQCINEWNFETGIVQKDMALYAKWVMQNEKNDFAISRILPQTYTGKEIKPVIQVYDKDILLKANKDYKVTYKNNINCKEGELTEEFQEDFPTVIIEGKGNYQGTLQLNFVIKPANISTTAEDVGENVKLSFTDQLAVNPKADQTVFKSISYLKSMKAGKDFEVSLKAVKAFDKEGRELSGELNSIKIPAGSKGDFELVITGKGNYIGTIRKEIVVTDKDCLLKNAKITLGSQLKSIPLSTYREEYKGSLEAGFYDAITKSYYHVKNGFVDFSPEKLADKNKIYTVKCADTELIYGKDFTATVSNDKEIGMATLTIHGLGQYEGSKTTTFRLTGTTLTTKNIRVEGLENRAYTGKPIIQNQVSLFYTNQEKESIPLEYGKDYYITYSKNINVGTASITFTAVPDSGYQGSIKKNFKILSCPMEEIMPADESLNIVLPYEKTGVKPKQEIILKNSRGDSLVFGKDYTLSYKNNKAVAQKEDEKPPTIIIKGKGNYKGEKKISFSITKALIDNKKITVNIGEIWFQPKKADSYSYKPSVTIKSETATLSQKTDYTVEYLNHSQKDCREYLENVTSGTGKIPKVVIKLNPSGNYTFGEKDEIVLRMPIYGTKFTSKNLHVVISQMNYTGAKITPKVEVYYAPNNNASKLKGMTTEEEIAKVDDQVIKLTSKDYTLEFKNHLLRGANKGTVTVVGDAPGYGGSVTFKFSVMPRILDVTKDMSVTPEEEPTEPEKELEDLGREPQQPGGEITDSEENPEDQGKDPQGPGGGGTTDPKEEIAKIDPITTEQRSPYAGDYTMDGYEELKTVLKNQIVPQSVKEIMEDFPRTFSYLDKFNIGIGLKLFFGEYSPNYASTLAYVSSYPRWDTNVTPIEFELFYSLGVNVSLASFEDVTAGRLTEDGRTKMECVVAHEMMHAMMFEALTAGMLGVDCYNNDQTKNRLPVWFTEGVAQAVGGGSDVVYNSMRMDEEMTTDEITSVLSHYYLDKDNYQSNYGTGYLAVMYLGSCVDGKKSIQSSDIANGLDIFLSEILKGKSMETVIKEKTSYTSVTDFTSKFPQDGAEFTKRLLTEIGDGLGALAADNYRTIDILDNQDVSENVFYLNITRNEILNTYPKNYIVMSGGLLGIDGLASPGYFSTQSN